MCNSVVCGSEHLTALAIRIHNIEYRRKNWTRDSVQRIVMSSKEIHEAVSVGDIQTVVKILKENPSLVNQKDEVEGS